MIWDTLCKSVKVQHELDANHEIPWILPTNPISFFHGFIPIQAPTRSGFLDRQVGL